MSEESDDIAAPIVKTLLSSFAGDTRPATMEDVAKVYATIIQMADAMVNLLQVAGATEREQKLNAIDQFQQKFHQIIDGVAEDSKALMRRGRDPNNG